MSTTEQARARRDELHAQEVELEERIDDIHAECERVRQAEEPPPPEWMSRGQRAQAMSGMPSLSASNAALAQARIDAARGEKGAAEEAQRLQEHIADTQRRLDEGVEGERVLREAIEAVRADLSRLYVDEFDAFAAHAEAFTQCASEKLEELREPWAGALAAWNEAAAAWQPLVAPNGLTSVPRCPLPAPDSVFRVADRFVDDGTPIVFEPANTADDRSPITVMAGDGLHDALRSDPQWKATAVPGADGAVPAARPADVALREAVSVR